MLDSGVTITDQMLTSAEAEVKATPELKVTCRLKPEMVCGDRTMIGVLNVWPRNSVV